jgi:geranylgeranyl pyrophosphate synthase
MLVDYLNSVPGNVLNSVKQLDLSLSFEEENSDINDLLQRTVLAGGKRLRPLLTFLMGNLFSAPDEDLVLVAKVIEMVHAASLAHDDVIDEATTRRGVPSINVVASNKKAVLAGDFLLADTMLTISKLENISLVTEMSNIIKKLADGEWLQLKASETRNYSEALIEKVAIYKTGSVMSWCCTSPAILTSQSSNVINLCREMGESVGVAFQLIDDTLDFNNSSEKNHLADLENGIVNAVIFEWLNLNPELNARYKNGEDIKNFWTSKHLDEAISIVREKGLLKLETAKKLLEKISTELMTDNNKKEQLDKLLSPINMMFHFLSKRVH